MVLRLLIKKENSNLYKNCFLGVNKNRIDLQIIGINLNSENIIKFHYKQLYKKLQLFSLTKRYDITVIHINSCYILNIV